MQRSEKRFQLVPTGLHMAAMASSVCSDGPESTSDEPSSCGGTDSSEASRAKSLISLLKAPKRSELSRSRRVAVNPKRPKRASGASSSSDPHSVTPTQRAREFSSECILVSAGKLFCRACREELSLKKSTLDKHVCSVKHRAGKERLSRSQKEEMDIVQALKKYDAEVHPSGETLPDSVRVYRVKVLRTFLKSGVPISKIDDFRPLFEESGYRLAGRKPMSDLIPFVLTEERRKIKAEIEGLPVAVIFDGTSRLGEALAVIIRFVDRSTLTIHQRLIKMQLLSKSLAGEEVARELLSVLSTEFGVSSNSLLAVMHDRASVNAVAVRKIKVLYPLFLDIGCYSHTIDHVGDKFSTPILHEFGILWISLFSHSHQARLLWRSQTSQSMRSFSPTRWWSRWEIYDQLLNLFGDVQPFLQDNPDLSPATRIKLLSILEDSQKKAKLQLELAAVIDAGAPFVKATYGLEGDGALVLSSYDVIASLTEAIRTAHFPNLRALSTKLSASNATLAQQYEQYGHNCVQPGMQYFMTRFTQDLKESVDAFKAARLFVPRRIVEMQPDANSIDGLVAFPFLNDQDTLLLLKKELPDYIAKATDVSAEMDPLEWWSRQEENLPHWSAAVRKVVLVQPSSAAAERVFSLLKATFSDQQDSTLQDYLETSLMLQYNKE